jgi:hypothetical protein
MWYLSTGDVFAVIIALAVSLTLIVTTILRNIQLTHQRDNYRRMYLIQKEARSFINGSDFQNYPVLDWRE